MKISVNTAVKTTLVGLLHVYRLVISPLFPPCCRYYPSCSAYAVQAIRLHGPILGGWLALKRLGRCHPWAPGGHDPVPARASGSPARSLSAAASAPQAAPSASDFFLRGVPPRAPRLKAPARPRSSTMEQPSLVAGAPRGRLLHGRERLS